MERDPFLTGRRLACWAAMAIGACAATSAILLRPGLPGEGDFAERMRWITEHRASWTTAWIIRMGAVLFLLGAFGALSRTLTPGFPVLRTLSGQLASVGAAAEILAATFLAAALPPLAERYLADAGAGAAELEPVLSAMEGTAVAVSGLAGIGLLSFAGALLSYAGWCTPPFPRGLAVFSVLVWGCGALAAGTTLAGSAHGLTVLTLGFFPLLALWLALLAFAHFRPPTGR